MGSSDPLAGAPARLASTARLDEIVDTVLNEIVGLGFGAVWVAQLEEPTGVLVSLKAVIDGVDLTAQIPKISMFDLRQPNANYVKSSAAPLIERNPLLFWKSTTIVLALAVIVLLAMLHGVHR